MLKILFTLALLCASVFADYNAKVVKIIDGDTIKILTDENRLITIRLYGIDAPEKLQPYSKAAKKILNEKIAAKIVTIKDFGSDRYKRRVAKVFLDGEDIDKFMVRNGYAWAFTKYSRDYTDDEEYAREHKFGLWRGKEQTPPWEFRKKCQPSRAAI